MVYECKSDDDFRQKMSVVGQKPVIIDFTASWCGPCKLIAPVFEELSITYGSAMVFMKVDVDVCEESASANGVTAMPTFMVFVNGDKMEVMRGGNKDALQELVKKWAKAGGTESEVPGQMELSGLIEYNQTECLNGCDDTPLRTFLEGAGGSILRSDVDEQIIVSVPFMQPVRLHSIRFKGNGTRTPKVIRVFANLPKPLDFDGAQGIEPIQMFELGEQAGKDGQIVGLKYVKFQNVRNVQLFFENNQEGGEVTELTELKFYGTPVSTTNMDNFKRVAGKAGEGAGGH